MKKREDIQRNVDGSPTTFIVKDFEFRRKNNKRIENTSTKEVNKATINNIKWCVQKSLDNRQVCLKLKIHKKITLYSFSK